MKELIYLDTDFLHSFLAQTQGGLATEKTREFQEEETNVKENVQTKDSNKYLEFEGRTGQIKIPFFLESPEGKLVIHYQPNNSYSERFTWQDTDIGKEVIKMKLHDNALTEFEKYMKEKGLLKNVTDEKDLEGYVEIESCFDLFDFNLFHLAFSEDFVKAMLFNMREENELKILGIKLDPSIKSNQKNFHIKQIEENYKHVEEYHKNRFKNLKHMLDMLIKLMPSNVFLRTENAIVPLKENFLRDNRNELVFKYGSGANGARVKILGKVTRKIKFTPKEKDNDVIYPLDKSFQELAGLIDEIFIQHLKIVKNDSYVINPIAVYFE